MILDYIVYGDVTIGDLLLVIVIFFIAVIIARITTMNIRKMLSDKLSRDQLELLNKIIYYSIILVALIAVLPIIGLNLTGLLVAGGFAGLVLGFASQNIVANLVSGIFLLSERPIKIGDQISIGDVSGFVEDISIMSTIVRTYDGLYVRIPNEKVFTSNIINYVANAARRFEYTIGIRYSDDAEKAIEIIRNVIEEHPFALKHPQPVVFVENLGESSVDIVVKVWAPSTEWYSVKMDLLWKIKKALEENGIEIPFPQRVIWFANQPKF